MKFKLHNLKHVSGRLGRIYDVERLPSFQLETPNLLFFTKVCLRTLAKDETIPRDLFISTSFLLSQGGCIPHLTHDVMLMLTNELLPLQYPLATVLDASSAIEKVGQGLATFVGLPVNCCWFQLPYLSYITVSITPVPSSMYRNFSRIAAFKTLQTSSELMASAKVLQPFSLDEGNLLYLKTSLWELLE